MAVDDRDTGLSDDASRSDAIAAAEAEARAAQERARVARARAAEARLNTAQDVDIVSDDTPVPTRRTGRAARWAAAVLAVAAVLGFAGASVWMVRGHHALAADRQRAAQYSAAARQGVINLMAINYDTAPDDVQRVLDSATGRFKEDFEATSKDLVKALEDGKIVTDVDVKAVAVESITPDSAVVLVSAISQRGDPKAENRDPRTWRAVVTMNRDGDQIKISNLEFV